MLKINKSLIRSYIFKIFNIYYSLKGVIIGQQKVLELEGLKFKFPISPYKDVGKKFRNHEVEERYLITKYLQKDDIVLELGGCIGVVSCLINNILEQKENQVVVEPNPRMLEFLMFNKKLNNSKFSIIDKIISNNSKNDFFIYDEYMSSSSKKRNQRNLISKIKIEGVKIKDLEKLYNLKFNTLIMDIEGGEIDIVKSFDLNSFKKLIIEYHHKILSENDRIQYLKQLEKFKFKLVERKGDVEYWKKLH